MSKQSLQKNREQAERLAELGMRLRDLRQQQEISLEQVAGKTRIQSRLLRAIEQGKLEELPEAVYIHSFLRQYADAVGLNGVEFASDFPTTPGEMPIIRRSWRSLPGAQLRPMHLYLMYMLLIVTAVNGLSYMMRRSEPAPIATAEIQRVQAPIVGPLNPVQAKVTTKKVSTSSKPVRVGMTLVSDSWIRVMADGKTEFEGVLPQGTQRTWVGNKQVVLRAGNAGGVIVSFNGAEAKPLGQVGAIEEAVFPPEPRYATLPGAGQP